MQEFTTPDNGRKFDALRERLESQPNVIQVFTGVVLPAKTCFPAEVRLGFKAVPIGNRFAYTVLIDKIFYNGTNYLFRQWVIDGEWTFPNYKALKTFFRTQLKHL